MIIWLIAGYSGSGKTEAAKQMLEILPASTSTTFAKCVKDDVSTIYNIQRDTLETQEGKAAYIDTYESPSSEENEKDCRKTARDLLISHSSTMKTLYGDDIWAKYVASEIQSVYALYKHIVVHDWRYIDEYDTLRSRFPLATIKTVRIIRSSVRPMNVPSEHELDDFNTDIVLHNDTTIPDFISMLELVCEH